jgi:hypothetical protein
MLILLLTSCLIPTSTVVVDLDQCEVNIATDVESAAPGDTVTLGGGAFTEAFDTVVTVDGTRAQVAAVTRDDCSECDQCRQFAQCNDCEACTECDETCSTCNQTVDFVVPAIAPGPSSVVLVNQYATSNTVMLTVEGTGDTGDAGTEDTGDTGTSDTGASDTVPDTGSSGDDGR